MHAADGAGFGEAHVRPRLSSVGRFVDAGTRHARAEKIVFASADPHDVFIGGCDRDVTNTRSGLVFEDRLPSAASVRRFPHAAVRRPKGSCPDCPVNAKCGIHAAGFPGGAAPIHC